MNLLADEKAGSATTPIYLLESTDPKLRVTKIYLYPNEGPENISQK